MSSDPDFGTQLEALTETYFFDLGKCVELLPQILSEYEDNGSYDETLEQIQALESDCDRTVREINATITNAGPSEMGLLNSRVHFNSSALIQFYQKLDVIANTTERIAQELQMMQPAHGNECYDGLQEMAACTAREITTLEDVVQRFVHSLRNTTEQEVLTAEIAAIRDMESECDRIRNRVIATAFEDDSVAQPLMYREFAILFDELANTMEDVTDQIIIISSHEPGIVAESRVDTDTQ